MNAKCLIWALALLTMISVTSPAIGTDFAKEQVMTLPEDGHVWATLVFTSDNWATNQAERKVLAWFASNPQLASLSAQTKFHHYTASNPLYKHRFAGVVQNQFPCVIVQTFDGKKAYKISGANMPKTSDELADAISTKLKSIQIVRADSVAKTTMHEVYYDGCEQDRNVNRLAGRLLRPRPVCPGPNCPTPTPVQPAPGPVVDVKVPVLDDVPKHDEHAEEPKLGLVAILFGVGALAAVGVMLHKAVN